MSEEFQKMNSPNKTPGVHKGALGMGPAPREIDGAKVLCFTTIDRRHHPSGNCNQIVAGVLEGPAAILAIGRYAGETGYYLFGCNAVWEVVTDTWHPTLDDAKAQAEFEYQGVSSTWQAHS